MLTNKHDGTSRVAALRPAFAAFCKDWGVVPRAPTPRRARTKSRVEKGVGYVKHSAIAGLEFISFQALQAHLQQWMHEADRRIHGTTRKRPVDLFDGRDAAALLPLPARPVAARTRRLKRKVANNYLVDVDVDVDVDTVRYSASKSILGDYLINHAGETQVNLYTAEACVATHARYQERHHRIIVLERYSGLLGDAQKREAAISSEEVATEGNRPLSVYEQVVEGAASWPNL